MYNKERWGVVVGGAAEKANVKGRATKCNHSHKREFNNRSFGMKFF
jgi:hypothetical protein